MLRTSVLLIFLFLATSAYSQTYYVATTGKNSDCTTIQTQGTPALTITFALNCAGSPETDQGAGKTVIVGNGTYAEQLWRKIPNGTAGNVFTLRAANQRQAVIKPSSVPDGSSIMQLDNTVHYVVLDGLTIDGSLIAGSVEGLGFSSATESNLNHITIQNMEIRSVTASGIGLYGSNYTITNNYIHDGGTNNFDHACYCHPSSSVIHGNTFANWTGYGWHPNTGGLDTINDNEISGNIFTGLGFVGGQWAVLLAGRNQRFFNNLIYGNNAAMIVGHFVNTTDTNYIYENTIYNNPNGTYQAIVLQGQSNTYIQNNIIRQSGAAWDSGFETPTLFANNICSSSETGCTNADPSFANASGNDFHLTSGSTVAIDQGATLGAPYNIDYAGIFRPQDGGYDIGAYEYQSGVVCLYTDCFDRGDGTIGANYYTGYTGWATPTISSNAVIAGAIGNNSVAVWSTPQTQNQYAQITLSTWSNTTDAAVILRASVNPTPTFYYVMASPISYGYTTAIVMCQSGEGCTYPWTDSSVTWAQGDQLKAQIVDSTITIFRNGVPIGSPYTDSAALTGSLVGFGMYGNSPLSAMAIDNFLAGSLLGPTAPHPGRITPLVFE